MPFGEHDPLGERMPGTCAGTVSRFFASRVWSKVPRKAIGHLACPASRGALPVARCSAPERGRWTRTEVEEWEEPLHPGPLPALLPHFLPHRNPSCTFSPTVVLRLTPRATRNHRAHRGSRGGSGRRARSARSRNATCDTRRCIASCRPCSGFRPPGVPARWGVVGAAAPRGCGRPGPPRRANRGVVRRREATMPRRCRPPSAAPARRRLLAVLAALVTAAGAVGRMRELVRRRQRIRPGRGRPGLGSGLRRGGRRRRREGAAGRRGRAREDPRHDRPAGPGRRALRPGRRAVRARHRAVARRPRRRGRADARQAGRQDRRRRLARRRRGDRRARAHRCPARASARTAASPTASRRRTAVRSRPASSATRSCSAARTA